MPRLTALVPLLLALACLVDAGRAPGAARARREAPAPPTPSRPVASHASDDPARGPRLPVRPALAEARFAALVNGERARRGLKTLAWDSILAEASRQHSAEMARLGYFDHTSPVNGLETPADRWERLVARPPDAYAIGENLFYGTAPDPDWGHRSLMESPDHRANILSPEFTHIGVGVTIAPDGRMWVTEMFLS